METSPPPESAAYASRFIIWETRDERMYRGIIQRSYMEILIVTGAILIQNSFWWRNPVRQVFAEISLCRCQPPIQPPSQPPHPAPPPSPPSSPLPPNSLTFRKRTGSVSVSRSAWEDACHSILSKREQMSILPVSCIVPSCRAPDRC